MRPFYIEQERARKLSGDDLLNCALKMLEYAQTEIEIKQSQILQRTALKQLGCLDTGVRRSGKFKKYPVKAFKEGRIYQG